MCPTDTENVLFGLYEYNKFTNSNFDDNIWLNTNGKTVRLQWVCKKSCFRWLPISKQRPSWIVPIHFEFDSISSRTIFWNCLVELVSCEVFKLWRNLKLGMKHWILHNAMRTSWVTIFLGKIDNGRLFHGPRNDIAQNTTYRTLKSTQRKLFTENDIDKQLTKNVVGTKWDARSLNPIVMT